MERMSDAAPDRRDDEGNRGTHRRESNRGSHRREFLRTPRDDRLPVGELLRLVAGRERRIVLQYLRRQGGGPVTIDSVADTATAIHREFDPDHAREDTLLSLHHVSLPKLAAAGLVEYDGTAGTVRYDGDDRVERVLDVALELGVAV